MLANAPPLSAFNQISVKYKSHFSVEVGLRGG